MLECRTPVPMHAFHMVEQTQLTLLKKIKKERREEDMRAEERRKKRGEEKEMSC
jgi:hypothetical protein